MERETGTNTGTSWSTLLLDTTGHILRFVAHGRPVIELALKMGWRPAARYTNLRDIRGLPFKGLGFLDIDWKRYDFGQHLAAAAQTRPFMTVARDIERVRDLDRVLMQAEELRAYSCHVVVVPKATALTQHIERVIPRTFILGYSVPTQYGATRIPPKHFTRPVHLLGGRPDIQRQLASAMPVVSLDCNRFTLDARYGDYFDGETFRPHPRGGYRSCLQASMRNIASLWRDYIPPTLPTPNGRSS